MAKAKVMLDPVGNTMNLWWGDPATAFESEEVDNPYRNDVIIKNKSGQPIGIEIIGLFPEELNVSKLQGSLVGSGKEPYLLISSN